MVRGVVRIDEKGGVVYTSAGVGSRYGGLKQLEPVGPNGEALLEYSVYDALRAGFSRVVLVVRPETERLFRESFGDGMATRIPGFGDPGEPGQDSQDDKDSLGHSTPPVQPGGVRSVFLPGPVDHEIRRFASWSGGPPPACPMGRSWIAEALTRLARMTRLSGWGQVAGDG